MLTKEERQEEQRYLLKVIDLLEREIESSHQKVHEYQHTIKNNLKYTWDYDNQTDLDEWANNVMDIERKNITMGNVHSSLKAYTRMLKSAYFARIDFETEGEVLKVYIGIATLTDGTNFFVYDWRAPISSLFYDYETGNAEYETPDGQKIKGKIVLKRQFKIEGDKIVQVFDTASEVYDDILRQMLESKSSDKMRNIVTTIQKEQNRVIRKRGIDILLVDGPAGSGKTSVAMHKIAYLLYIEKNNLANSNILIISPNEIFSNYISSVLPEIGEENVYQSTFMDFVSGQIDFKILGSSGQMYETYYNELDKPQKSIQYNSLLLKYGSAYIHLIENYLDAHRFELLNIHDIVIDDNVVIDADFLKKLSTQLESNGVSLYTQGQRLIEKIMLHLSVRLGNKNPATMLSIKKEMEANLAKISARELYLGLYSDKKWFVNEVMNIYSETQPQYQLSRNEVEAVFDYTKDLLDNTIVPFEDVIGYLYLKDRTLGSTVQSKIKYVLIDEAQDYTVMQYKILAHLFRRASITILGDLNQSITPFATHQNYETILNLLKEGRVNIKTDMNCLTKTYRSTYEINSFAKNILGGASMYNQVDRHGKPVEIVKDKVGKNTLVFDKAISEKAEYNSVAIITKTQAEANQLYEYVIERGLEKQFKLFTEQDKVFSTDKIIIIPSYLAKGLEFDSVLVYNASEENYGAKTKNLLYVVCTRALHSLIVYYTGNLSKLLTQSKNAK